jgi:hypothetical protein
VPAHPTSRATGRVLSDLAPSGRSADWDGAGRLRLWARRGATEMDCVACGSTAVTERPERTAQGYRRFRGRTCGKQFNDVARSSRARFRRIAIARMCSPDASHVPCVGLLGHGTRRHRARHAAGVVGGEHCAFGGPTSSEAVHMDPYRPGAACARCGAPRNLFGSRRVLGEGASRPDATATVPATGCAAATAAGRTRRSTATAHRRRAGMGCFTTRRTSRGPAATEPTPVLEALGSLGLVRG